jgi:hypothetical protein
MKTLNRIFLAIAFTLTFSQTQAQLDKFIIGDWKANCMYEREASGNLLISALCPNKIVDNAMVTSAVSVSFDGSSMRMLMSDGIKVIPYRYDKKLETIEFTYNNYNFKLKILVSGSSNEIILKDENCMLVLLTKG